MRDTLTPCAPALLYQRRRATCAASYDEPRLRAIKFVRKTIFVLAVYPPDVRPTMSVGATPRRKSAIANEIQPFR